jgi:hypothetical protein
MIRVLMTTLITFVITTVGATAAEVSIKGHRPSQVKAGCHGDLHGAFRGQRLIWMSEQGWKRNILRRQYANPKANLQYVSGSKQCHASDVEQAQREYAMSLDTDRM